jgi:hypothetical protein
MGSKSKKMKYTDKFSLEIKMADFYKMAIPRVETKELHESIRYELRQCWCGIVNGSFGGEATDWRSYFYYQLWIDGVIDQTDACIDVYGRFKAI